MMLLTNQDRKRSVTKNEVGKFKEKEKLCKEGVVSTSGTPSCTHIEQRYDQVKYLKKSGRD